MPKNMMLGSYIGKEIHYTPHNGDKCKTGVVSALVVHTFLDDKKICYFRMENGALVPVERCFYVVCIEKDHDFSAPSDVEDRMCFSKKNTPAPAGHNCPSEGDGVGAPDPSRG